MKTLKEAIREIDLIETVAEQLLLTAQETAVLLVSTLRETHSVLSKVKALIHKVENSNSLFSRENRSREI